MYIYILYIDTVYHLFKDIYFDVRVFIFYRVRAAELFLLSMHYHPLIIGLKRIHILLLSYSAPPGECTGYIAIKKIVLTGLYRVLNSC